MTFFFWSYTISIVGIVTIVLSSLATHNSVNTQNELRVAAQPIDILYMYVNPVTGNDGNSGRTPSDPVATLAQALLNFDTDIVVECTIVLLETVQFAESDPVISFFPAVRQCQHITITAPRNVLHRDIVVDTEAVHPNSYNWTQVELQTGGLTDGQFAGLFVENQSQKRVYVVENNTGTTLVALAGYIDPSAVVKSFTSAETDAWHIGDELELFDVQVAIQWTGTLLFDIPYNEVLISNLRFSPLSSGSVARFTDVNSQITLQGCDLEARGEAVNNASYMGYAAMYGVHCRGISPTVLTYFSAFDPVHCIHMESVLFTDIDNIQAGVCSAIFLKFVRGSTIAIQSSGTVYQQYYSVKIDHTDLFSDDTISVLTGVQMIFDGLYIAKSRPTGTTVAITMDVTVLFVVRDLEILCLLPGCGQAFLLGKNCRLTLSGHINIQAGRIINSLPFAQLHINDPESIVMTDLSVTQPFIFNQAMIITITLNRAVLVLNKPTAAPSNGLMWCVNCHLTLEGNRTNYRWSTLTGTPLILVQTGGRVIDRTSDGGMSVQGNFGASPGNIIKCGSGAIYNWATSQFSASDNSMCTAVI